MAFFPTSDLVAKPVENYVWDVNTMAWVKETQAGGGGGGGGGTVDQGTGGASAWLTKLSQAGTDNDVDVATIAAGTNVIGRIGIDQTTPGTTNKVTVGSDVV